MKKFACLVLALAMVFSLGISASAVTDTIKAVPGLSTGDVSVTISGTESIVYYVNVEWKDLTFTYDGTKTWDPATHDYIKEPEWTTTAIENAIVVENHSNAAVKISVNKTAYDTNRGVEFSVTTTGNETLATAVDTPVNAPPSVSYKVAVNENSAPSNLSAGTFKIGQITVNIAAAA